MEFPHKAILAQHPDITDKLSKEIKLLIQEFDRQEAWINEEFKVIGGGVMKEKTESRKARAIQNLAPFSQNITDYINEFIIGLTAAEAAAEQKTDEAAQAIEDLKDDAVEIQEENEELFEDLEQFIQEHSTKKEWLVGCFVDDVAVVNQVPNPNYGKKYRIKEDGTKEYL